MCLVFRHVLCLGAASSTPDTLGHLDHLSKLALVCCRARTLISRISMTHSTLLDVALGLLTLSPI